jgi:Arc/MetJ-type ribon-helix-helix transcriptional regulator
MAINLPEDLNRFIQAEVGNGHFASEEAALAEAVRLLRRQVSHEKSVAQAGGTLLVGEPVSLLGVLGDIAEEIDEIVAEAMKQREAETWRLVSGE